MLYVYLSFIINMSIDVFSRLLINASAFDLFGYICIFFLVNSCIEFSDWSGFGASEFSLFLISILMFNRETWALCLRLAFLDPISHTRLEVRGNQLPMGRFTCHQIQVSRRGLINLSAGILWTLGHANMEQIANTITQKKGLQNPLQTHLGFPQDL